jgi:hypothetical protein
MADTPNSQFPTWVQPDGKPLSCRDKIKVLNENLEEIREMAQDALEDAVLMGCDEGQVRQVLHDLMNGLENPYAAPGGSADGGGADSAGADGGGRDGQGAG